MIGKNLIYFIFALVLAQTAVSSSPASSAIHSKTTSMTELASLGDITLTASTEKDGLYKKITVHTGHADKTFNWVNVANPSFYPSVTTADVNNDGKKEIVVILTTGTGTGVHMQDIHVLDASLKELPIENPVDAINSKSNSSITLNDGVIHALVKYDGKTVEQTFRESDTTLWNQTVSFGAIVEYKVVHDKITATIPGAVSPTQYAVDALIEYGNDLRIKTIDFEKIMNDNPPEAPSETASAEEPSDSKLNLMAADSGNNVKLYHAKDQEGVYLEMEGKRKFFDWTYRETGTEPQLFYTDLTGDGNMEAVVILTIGRGTELNLQEIHVVDSTTFTEIQVEDPLDAIQREVSSQVTQSGETVDISVDVQDQHTHLQKQGPILYLNGKVGFGSVIYYLVEDGKLSVSLAGNISMVEYVGDMNISYDWDGRQLHADKIQFEAYE